MSNEEIIVLFFFFWSNPEAPADLTDPQEIFELGTTLIIHCMSKVFSLQPGIKAQISEISLNKDFESSNVTVNVSRLIQTQKKQLLLD